MPVTQNLYLSPDLLAYEHVYLDVLPEYLNRNQQYFLQVSSYRVCRPGKLQPIEYIFTQPHHQRTVFVVEFMFLDAG